VGGGGGENAKELTNRGTKKKKSSGHFVSFPSHRKTAIHTMPPFQFVVAEVTISVTTFTQNEYSSSPVTVATWSNA
jgi:hypothetical protein